MKSVDQEKNVQLFESNIPAMRLPLAFPEPLGRNTLCVSNYQRAQVALFAFGIFAAVAGAVLAMRAAVWVPG